MPSSRFLRLDKLDLTVGRTPFTINDSPSPVSPPRVGGGDTGPDQTNIRVSHRTNSMEWEIIRNTSLPALGDIP